MQKPTYEELEQRIKELEDVTLKSEQARALSLTSKDNEIADGKRACANSTAKADYEKCHTTPHTVSTDIVL